MPSVTIIGGGPAGAIAGLLLARAGWDAAIIEQHRFGRDKVCGECLSGLGIEVLNRTGLREQIQALGTVLLQRAVLIGSSGRKITVSLPKPTWGISRRALDRALLESARDAGARLIQPARCEGISSESLSATYRMTEHNAIQTRYSDYILLADGKAFFASERPPMTSDLGIKAHFAGIREKPDRILLFGLNGHYLGLAPIEGDQWNLAMSVPAGKVKRFGGDLDALFGCVLNENTRLRECLCEATRIGNWLASPLPRFAVREHWADRVIPLGNAAAAIEPIGGEGMGLAMRSAEMVAEDLITKHHQSRAVSSAQLRWQMKHLWRRKRIGCRAGAVILSHRRICRVIAPFASPLAPLALRLMGK
jgi:2-polyprenyl-6-methoxyphenol hydroxylase-like FAD-dependent oxidoreductase